ncbi:MAG: hypothetical protein J7527_14785, partial [Chitinophagaceae bacterium]|nr:hypothetical protein [Chitinophagaceae bacterium]
KVNVFFYVGCVGTMPGVVQIALSRGNTIVKQLTCPEWITEYPYRTDRLTYSYSTESLNTLKKLFGTDVFPLSTEYNANATGNHLQYYQPSR